MTLTMNIYFVTVHLPALELELPTHRLIEGRVPQRQGRVSIPEAGLTLGTLIARAGSFLHLLNQRVLN